MGIQQSLNNLTASALAASYGIAQSPVISDIKTARSIKQDLARSDERHALDKQLRDTRIQNADLAEKIFNRELEGQNLTDEQKERRLELAASSTDKLRTTAEIDFQEATVRHLEERMEGLSALQRMGKASTRDAASTSWDLDRATKKLGRLQAQWEERQAAYKAVDERRKLALKEKARIREQILNPEGTK